LNARAIGHICGPVRCWYYTATACTVQHIESLNNAPLKRSHSTFINQRAAQNLWIGFQKNAGDPHAVKL